MGKIVTFYSYKGGTGRSMALANVAWALASQDQTVLVVDWDLEAPGLHRYFSPFLADRNLFAPEAQGLIEFVRSYATQVATPAASDRAANWYEAYADIGKWRTSLSWPDGKPLRFGERGELIFVSAGRQGPDYAERVNAFDWYKLYKDQSGGAFFDTVREKMRNGFDYVLIDSRTGVSDTSGICTIQMPDVLVVCYTFNVQSIEGAADIANRVRARRPDISIFPVAMRVESGETEALKQMRQYAFRRFSGFVEARERATYFDDMQVPYYPKYAYWETLAAFEDCPGAATGSVYRQMNQLAGLLAGEPIQPVLVPEERKEQVLAVFRDLSPSQEILAPAPVSESFRPWPMVWATAALSLAVALGWLLWSEPSPGKRKADSILAAVGFGPQPNVPPTNSALAGLTRQDLVPFGSSGADTQLTALLETADLPEPTRGRELFRILRQDGIPISRISHPLNPLNVLRMPDMEQGLTDWRLDEVGGRLLGCGGVGFGVWRIDTGQVVARSVDDLLVSACEFGPGPNQAVVSTNSEVGLYEWRDAPTPIPIPAIPTLKRPPHRFPSLPAGSQRRVALQVGGTQAALFDYDPATGKGEGSLWRIEPEGAMTEVQRRALAAGRGTPAALDVSPLRLLTGRGTIVWEETGEGGVDTGLRMTSIATGESTLVRVPGRNPIFALSPAEDKIAVADFLEVRVLDARTGARTQPVTPVTSVFSLQFSGDGEHLALGGSTLELRTVEGLKHEWSAPENAPSVFALGERAMVILAGGVYRRDRPLDTLNEFDWRGLTRALRAYTSVCMSEFDRARILVESAAEARSRFEACEASQGRPPRDRVVAYLKTGDAGEFTLPPSMPMPATLPGSAPTQVTLWFVPPGSAPAAFPIPDIPNDGLHLEVVYSQSSPLKVNVTDRRADVFQVDGRILDELNRPLKGVELIVTRTQR